MNQQTEKQSDASGVQAHQRHTARKKIVGGKMLTVEWQIEDNKITFFKLSGDFFAHPEWCIEAIERAVIGTKVSDLKATVEEKIHANNFELIGFSAEDIQKIIMGDIE